MKTVTISEAEYKRLLKDSEFLDALRAVGVDNWEGYSEAYKLLEKDHTLRTLTQELHDLLCRHNHTDGCGWFYEDTDKNPELWNSVGTTKGEWLSRVKTLNSEFTISQIKSGLKMLKAFKSVKGYF